MKLNVIILDDEPLALDILSSDLSKIDDIHLVKVFSSANEAKNFLKVETIDLVISDIGMPILNGIDFVKGLTKPPMIIFYTAFKEYALESFELNVVDYLLKPVSFERLKNAIEKAKELQQLKRKNSNERRFFYVYASYEKVRVFEDEILYIEGLKDYVKIYITNRKHPLLTRLNLKGIEEKLDLETFCRVHQSYIVALNQISSHTKSNLYVGNIEIPIGGKYQQDILVKMDRKSN